MRNRCRSRRDGTRGAREQDQQASNESGTTRHGGVFSSAVVGIQSLVGRNRRNNLRWGIAVRQAGAGSRQRFRVIVRSKMVHSLLFLAVVVLQSGRAQRHGTHSVPTALEISSKSLWLFSNYHYECGSLPPAYIADEHGRPLHSWRVLILPYINQALSLCRNPCMHIEHGSSKRALDHSTGYDNNFAGDAFPASTQNRESLTP